MSTSSYTPRIQKRPPAQATDSMQSTKPFSKTHCQTASTENISPTNTGPILKQPPLGRTPIKKVRFSPSTTSLKGKWNDIPERTKRFARSSPQKASVARRHTFDVRGDKPQKADGCRVSVRECMISGPKKLLTREELEREFSCL
ncbi:hypothetical protein BKA93DRAFT_28123 [Sparassis latifolia]